MDIDVKCSKLLIIMILTLMIGVVVICYHIQIMYRLLGMINNNLKIIHFSKCSEFYVRETYPQFPEQTSIHSNEIIVAEDGSGTYMSIQKALDIVKPGDTIMVKNGIYTENVNIHINGTPEEPIIIRAYHDQHPVIDEELFEKRRVELNAEWVILDGFEIRNAYDGIKVYKGHNIIRNNWIHNNGGQGILLVSVSNVMIENNTIESNGTVPVNCGNTPKHCHAIYISDYLCKGMDGIVIRGNIIKNQGGRGIQLNGKSNGVGFTMCPTKITNTLVENNTIENCSWGMVLYYNVENAIIRNNIFKLNHYPKTDDTEHTFIGIYGSQCNTIINNQFIGSNIKFKPFLIADIYSTNQKQIDFNERSK